MNLKIILKLLILVFWIGYSNAQEVVATGGEYFRNSENSVVFTIGEPVIETLVNSGNIMTQGFNQSKLLVTAVNEILFEGIQLKVFPNPVLTCLHLNISKAEDFQLTYRLVDIKGNLLSVKNIQTASEIIEMQHYKAGNYLLYISDKNGINI
ncbi:MAG: T9SS type A sorting domain-containing protein, partial [Prolixibacteraceae bacterium]|nr:T9SS type A sorting domain-containing protein [Prolixibacteraceae bacterium]